jgi:hypothetical protein
MAVTSDAGLLPIFKTWYAEEKMENLLFRNSPVLKEIDKKRIGGEEYAFASMYGAGGNISASYTKAVANAASNAKNAKFKVTPGKLFSVYNVTQQEILASKDNKGAFIDAQVNRFFAGNENIRKGLAASLYGMGYGEVGTVDGAVTTGATTFTVDSYSTAIKLDVGAKIQVTNGTLPSSALFATEYEITKVDGLTVTISPAAADDFADGAYICYAGGRSGSTPLFPVGLAGWAPSIASRTGGDWDTYIGTSFFGVDRSVNPDKLAGSFVLRDSGASEKYSAALTRGVQALRRSGGVPNMIILNDEDWATIEAEIGAETAGYQQVNTSAKGSKKESVVGFDKIKFSFSSNFIEYVYDDPYCPKGTAYIVDKDVIDFISLSGTSAFDDGVSGNNPGSPDVDVDGEPGTNYELLIDDFVDVRPADDTDDGPGQRVSMNIYGNFIVRNTAHVCVVKF